MCCLVDKLLISLTGFLLLFCFLTTLQLFKYLLTLSRRLRHSVSRLAQVE
jgi:hypothetical protein